MLSSRCMILFIPVRKLSSPLNTIVSEYPLSVLHTGHVFVRASVPLYQPFTQCSHPSRVLQHLVKIGGILIGACRQTLHLNASVTISLMVRGTVLVLSSSLMSRPTAAMPAISSFISSRSLQFLFSIPHSNGIPFPPRCFPKLQTWIGQQDYSSKVHRYLRPLHNLKIKTSTYVCSVIHMYLIPIHTVSPIISSYITLYYIIIISSIVHSLTSG